MLALENMKKVNAQNYVHIPVSEWNWTPVVGDIKDLDQKFIEASGNNTTSRNTFSSQVDHGENY
jgi:hypothetical protein